MEYLSSGTLVKRMKLCANPRCQCRVDRAACHGTYYEWRFVEDGKHLHDDGLECRTNGSGLLREHSVAELKTLDVGYGYTADGGRTFPLRGAGDGLMPTLADALLKYPRQRFLI